MNSQKEIDLVKNAIMTDDTQEIVEIVSKLPRDFRLMWLGQVMGYAAARGITPDPPPMPPASAAMATAKAI